MRYQTKQRIIKAGLVALALWPLLHILVVRSTGISPWRGFGWGMYTVPVLEVDLAVNPLEGVYAESTEEGQATVIEEMKRYIRAYQALGSNARPDDIAESVFAAYPGLQLIEIEVIQHALDRKTARIVEDRHNQFRYRRGKGLETIE